jgi:hypothetical protein
MPSLSSVFALFLDPAAVLLLLAAAMKGAPIKEPPRRS